MRRQFRTQFTAGLMALFLLLVITETVKAAPKVSQLSRIPDTRPYDAASRVLGFPEWGEALSSDAAVHVLVRLSVRDLLVSISLPRSVPQTQAQTALQHLADSMRWPDAELSSARGPNGTFLSAHMQKATRSVGLGRRQTQLDLQRLRTQLAWLTPLPQFIAVRTPAQVLIPSASAEVQGASNGFRYAYYRVLPPGGTVTFTYGMSRRWQVALIWAWVAWALFPSLVFAGLREYLRRDEARSAQTRWQTYQRWIKPVWLVTLAGTMAVPYVLSFQGAAYFNALFGNASPTLFFLELLLPTLWVLVPAGLLGYPLSCALSAKLKERRFVDLLSGQLTVFAMAHAMVPILLWIEQQPASKPTDPLSGWAKLALGLLFLIPLLIGVYVWAAGKHRWHQRRQGLPAGEFEASPELTARIGELTAAHGYAITRVLLVSQGETERHRGAVVSGQMATVIRSVADQLTTGQVAALVCAECLSAVRSWREQIAAVTGISLATAGFGSIAGMLFFSTSSSVQPTQLQILLIAGLPLSAVPLLIDDRMRRTRQDRADLSVANSIADARTFLNALHVLELSRMDASNLDPALMPVPKHLTERRLRLGRRLGLE